MTFTLYGQLPSGKNAVIVTRTGHRFPAKRFKLWREDALIQLRTQMCGQCFPLREQVALNCLYTPGDKRIRDVPGMLDALCHLIVKAGLLMDDGQVRRVTWIENVMDRERAGVQFSVHELKPC